VRGRVSSSITLNNCPKRLNLPNHAGHHWAGMPSLALTGSEQIINAAGELLRFGQTCISGCVTRLL